MLLAQQMGSAALGGTSPLHTSKSNLVISDPIPGAQPLPVPPELAVFMGSGLGHPAVSLGNEWLMEAKNMSLFYLFLFLFLLFYLSCVHRAIGFWWFPSYNQKKPKEANFKPEQILLQSVF